MHYCMLITFYRSGQEMASVLNITVKPKHSLTITAVKVFNMRIMTNQNAVVMSFSKASIAAMSDVDRRRAISKVSTIIPGEELVFNVMFLLCLYCFQELVFILCLNSNKQTGVR